jgi:hypothetical protein
VAIKSPVRPSQNFNLLSRDTDAISEQSGEKATASTDSECPASGVVDVTLIPSYPTSSILPSEGAVTILSPSGDQAHMFTELR